MPAKVAIVEDEDSILTLLTYNLERAGYTVVSTKSGTEALFLIDEEQPDLVILVPGIISP